MRGLLLIMAGSILMGLATGCAWGVLVQPGKITLDEAISEVATGLNKMYDIRKDHPKSGLLPAEVTVSFNISASATDKGKLFVEAGATLAEVLQVTKAGADISSSLVAKRGNTVTIKFSNLLYADEHTLVRNKSPEEIMKLLQALEEAGVGALVK